MRRANIRTLTRKACHHPVVIVKLGDGVFGTVYEALHVQRNASRPQEWSKVAVKLTRPNILDRRSGPLGTYDDMESYCSEIKTLLRLRGGIDSPVVYLYEYFWRNEELALVTEFLGQNLEQWRDEQKVIYERDTRRISQTVIAALDYIHQKGVVHRNVNLSNVLFRRNGDFASLKIVGFGLATILDGAQTNDFCGTLSYISPEIYLNKPYGYEVDMFAVGVIIYRLLCGERPFGGPCHKKLQSDTINLRYNFQGTAWGQVSPEAMSIVRKLLIGREDRLTAEQAINHAWFHTPEVLP
jgi:calcium-dependent protein kinase